MAEKHNELIQKFQISENGFLLLVVSDKLLAEKINSYLKEGVEVKKAEHPEVVVVDFSSPNIAKEMHVGHLRSTIIGESVCRILESQGHDVRRVNHVGDWGTQFGMLIAHMEETYPEYLKQTPVLKDLEIFYAEAKRKFDDDPKFKEKSQHLVVELQKGNPEILKAWNILCDLSRAFFIKIYDRLDIKNNEFGESYYKDKIPGVLDELRAKDLVKMDKGALCMYIPGKKQPLMLIKSDGGFNYDTTDMAAAFHRLVTLKAQRCIYITDVGQQPHFELIFEGAKLAGWHTPPKNKMEHMGFGLVLSENGEKMKTRNGKNVKLMDLLDEAKDKAKSELDTRTGHEEDEAQAQAQDDSKRRTQLTPEEIDRASEILGIAAVKYFDLR